MIKMMLASIFLFFSAPLWAEEQPIALANAYVNLDNTASIRRGADFFGKVCIACHTMIYMQYNPIAKAAGVTLERMPLNVKQWPLDAKPPDLSLEADVRGADWIYTYLHSFYVDRARPTGANNLLVPNTAMSYILASYQGLQVKAADIDLSKRIYDKSLQWYDVLALQSQGSMSPAEFDETMRDVVSFLVYAAEPYHAEQRRLGAWVLGFLALFFVLVYLLKKSYWRDIKKEK